MHYILCVKSMCALAVFIKLIHDLHSTLCSAHVTIIPGIHITTNQYSVLVGSDMNGH